MELMTGFEPVPHSYKGFREECRKMLYLRSWFSEEEQEVIAVCIPAGCSLHERRTGKQLHPFRGHGFTGLRRIDFDMQRHMVHNAHVAARPAGSRPISQASKSLVSSKLLSA